MRDIRPSDDELRYLGLTTLQILLLSDYPDDLVAEVYREQLELLMSEEDDDVDF